MTSPLGHLGGAMDEAVNICVAIEFLGGEPKGEVTFKAVGARFETYCQVKHINPFGARRRSTGRSQRLVERPGGTLGTRRSGSSSNTARSSTHPRLLRRLEESAAEIVPATRGYAVPVAVASAPTGTVIGTTSARSPSASRSSHVISSGRKVSTCTPRRGRSASRPEPSPELRGGVRLLLPPRAARWGAPGRLVSNGCHRP